MSGDFLIQMARHSQARAQAARATCPLDAMRDQALATLAPPPLVIGAGGFDAIAEIKITSPAQGALASADVDADDIDVRARRYAAGGAIAVSVLTEPSQFHGSLQHLSVAAGALREAGVPAMRKDFLIDPYQVYEARAHGAGGVLLILRMLDDERLQEMLTVAASLGLFVLLEGFDAYDLQRAARFVSDGVLIGVNCRDLRTLQIDPARFGELIEHCPADAVLVAESGLETPAQATQLALHGYRMALVGTALMRAADPDAFLADLLAEGRAAASARG